MRLSDLMEKVWQSANGEWDDEGFRRWWKAEGKALMYKFRDEIDWRRLGDILR